MWRTTVSPVSWCVVFGVWCSDVVGVRCSFFLSNANVERLKRVRSFPDDDGGMEFRPHASARYGTTSNYD